MRLRYWKVLLGIVAATAALLSPRIFLSINDAGLRFMAIVALMVLFGLALGILYIDDSGK